MRKGSHTAPLPGTYDPLPAHLVAELVVIGFKAEAVEHWTIDKARVTLRSYKADADAAMLRADLKAGEIDGPRPIAGPLQLMRQAAAAWIGQSLTNHNADDLMFAVQGAVPELEADELKRLGEYMVRKLLGVSHEQLGRAV